MTDEAGKLSLLGQEVFYTSIQGNTRPAKIVRLVDPNHVNLIVFTDFSNDIVDSEFAQGMDSGTAWATTKRESVEGPKPGYWSWGSK